MLKFWYPGNVQYHPIKYENLDLLIESLKESKREIENMGKK